MHLLRALALAVLLLPAAMPTRAQPAAAPVLARHVTDTTGTLSAEQIAALEAPLAELEKRKGSQL
ncbi:MAG: YgcG family protein, partial [Arenimonas sp.]